MPDASAATGASAAVQQYVQALLAQDPAAADSAWVAQDLAHCHRLGIRYTSAPPKQDSASALFAWLPALRAGTCHFEVQTLQADDTAARAVVRVRILNGSVLAEATYCAERVGARWRLASPLRHAVDGWPALQGRYVRLIAPDTAALSEFVLAELDQQVEWTAHTLQFDEPAQRRLAAGKIDWILASDEQVTAIAGTPTQGLANLQFDAVVTQERFHAHELAHVLVGVWLQELPLYTLPLLQEGIAVYLGGRWGRSAAVEQMLGAFVLSSGMTTLDELLEADAFRDVPADQSYAVAGLFCGFLLQTLGPNQLGELYRTLGGTLEQVHGMRRAAIVASIEQSTGTSWALLEQEFAGWWPARQDTGIRPGCRAAGEVARSMRELPSPVGADPLAARTHLSADGSLLRIAVDAPRVAPRGAVLLPSLAAVPSTSRRFAEQLPGAEYRGRRFGIVYDGEEVGLYDFGLDVLVAKFARALGGQGELWDAAAGCLCVEVDLRLLPAGIESNLGRWETLGR